jgi:DNA-directed RNA polymerase subunit RPC12/RpoP
LLSIKTAIFRFGDEDYYRSVILDVNKHMQSRELITYDLIETIIRDCFLILGLIPLSIAGTKRISYARISDICSKFFSKCKEPFIKAEDLPAYKQVNGRKKLNLVRKSIRTGYLKHCTIEKHSGKLEITLGKKVVKDTCPSCAAAITDAVTADYVCRYCGNKIMGVVVKK